MLERKLVRLAVAIGAAVWLVRLVVSGAERRKLDTAMRALDSVSFRGIDGLGYQRASRDEWPR